ncbi:MAG: leucine-rich repeat domain-containing protein, partial [Bacteroidaceae bacterium]|nr:leucine-rich repeat domain-containing protein [Bacteroidaceae bacterium]
KLFKINTSAFNMVDKANCTLYVPYGAKETYAATAGWNDFKNIVEESFNTCGESAIWTLNDCVLTVSGSGSMYNYSSSYPAPWNEYKNSIETVIINDGIKSIGNNAFFECSGITSIDIPNSLEIIGEQAFDGCSSLVNLNIPSSVTKIGQWAFATCPGLESIVVDKNNVVYDSRNNCNAIIEIETNTLIQGCKNTTIPDGIVVIAEGAFDDCTDLKEIKLPSSITTIGNGAFFQCTSLSSIEIPCNTTSIGTNAFDGCSALSEVIFNEGLEKIDGAAFASCTSLTNIVIPSSVTYIGYIAFGGCTSLTSITSHIPAHKLFKINTSAFNMVDKANCTLYVPYGAKETYAATAGWNDFTNIVELDPTEVTITINEYGSATYCSGFALDFSNVEGLKAYAATGYNTATQVVTLTRVQTAKEATGLFLMGTPGEYTVPIIKHSNDFTLNLLVGTLESKSVNGTTDDGNYINFKYTIGETSDAPLFYQFEDNSTLSAGKAYLQLPASLFPESASKSVSVRFDDGTTTDIEEVENAEGETQTIYDLQGRKVKNPTNGIYIINGKKVLVR